MASTVTVSLRVYAGVDVDVTIDGRGPDLVTARLPFLMFVFRNVDPEEHRVHVQDVVGHKESLDVFVPATGDQGPNEQ